MDPTLRKLLPHLHSLENPLPFVLVSQPCEDDVGI
jgi:hypothetical protein